MGSSSDQGRWNDPGAAAVHDVVTELTAARESCWWLVNPTEGDVDSVKPSIRTMGDTTFGRD